MTKTTKVLITLGVILSFTLGMVTQQARITPLPLSDLIQEAIAPEPLLAVFKDCAGGSSGTINVTNQSNIIIRNCNISGKIIIQSSNNVTIQNITITNCGTQSGCISMNGNTHDIIIEDFHIFGNNNTGWGISGTPSPNVLRNITVRQGLIEDIGQAGGVQTHGLYLSNWQGFLIEDVTILRSYNAGIKVVQDMRDGIFRRVIIRDSGQRGTSNCGGGIMLGQSDGQLRLSNILLIDSEITGNKCPGIYILDDISGFTVVNTIFSGNAGDPPSATQTPTRTPTKTSTPVSTIITSTPTNTATRTNTPTITPTRTPTNTDTVSRTPTVTRTSTTTPIVITSTPTSQPSNNQCIKVNWKNGLNLRPVPSLFSLPLTRGGYPENIVITIENIIPGYILLDGEKVVEGTWAVINRGQFVPIKTLGLTFASVVECQ